MLEERSDVSTDESSNEILPIKKDWIFRTNIIISRNEKTVLIPKIMKLIDSLINVKHSFFFYLLKSIDIVVKKKGKKTYINFNQEETIRYQI